ncbi:MAG: hypothetical protein NVSMB13_02050 [Mycobacteriales bacterium]
MSLPARPDRGVRAWWVQPLVVGGLGLLLTVAGPRAAHAVAGPAPAASGSHYLDTLDGRVLRRQGAVDATAAVAGGLRMAVVVLAAGTPAADDGSVTQPDSKRRAGPRELRAAVVDYVRGWSDVTSVRRPDLLLVLGTTNYGPATTRAHGLAWGGLVDAVNQELSSAGLAADVVGGLDAELEYNGPGPTLSWVDGYLAGTRRPYVDFGSCTCPPFATPPPPWTPEDIYAVASGSGRATVLPQVYATAGGSAKEWATVVRTSLATHPSAPVRLIGVLTEQAACHGPPARDCQGIDNPSATAWNQLVRALGGVGDAGLTYTTDIGYLQGPRPRPAILAPVVRSAGLVLLVAGLVLGLVLERRRRRR